MKKYTALILAIIMIFCCLTGCGAKETAKDVVMSADGVDVTWDEFMYYLNYAAYTLTNYYQSSTGGGVDWDGVCLYDKSITNAEWCVGEALYMAAQSCVILGKAKELGCEMTDEQIKELDDQIAEYEKTYADKGSEAGSFDDVLREQGLTRETFKKLSITNGSLSNVFVATYGENGEKMDDAAFEKYVEDNGYISSAHILFKTSDIVVKEDNSTETKELSDEEKAELKAKAESISKELQAISSDSERETKFFEYMNELSDDPGAKASPNGYTFKEGVMVQEYTDASKALKPYEVSGVVESVHGYHVIMGMPTTKTCIDVSNQYGYTLGQLAASYAFDEDMQGWDITSKAKFNSAYENYDFTKFFGDDGFVFSTYDEVFKAENADAENAA